MFGISHQKAGLNWAGRYKAWSRERALAEAWRFWLQHKRGRGSGFGVGCACGTPKNAEASFGATHGHAKWRRITGITSAVEGVLTAKERKAGLKRLVAWMENTIKNAELRIQNETENGKGSGFRVQGIGNDERPLSLTTAWGRGVESWFRATEGRSVESLCTELQVSRARLTMLTKEYCGLTVQELTDGFRIRNVKRGLVERLREAAQELWGIPGSYAATKYEMEPQMNTDEHGYRVQGSGFRVQGIAKKQSRYFRMRPEDYYYEDRAA
ncbi:MAG: hypothetical protein NTW87_07120 [Planctomycetota bacterium]|nr:hypothetical protein [Planctomycetota bacterium]